VIGLLPSILALLEKTVGERTHIFPGSEMLAAVETAERIGAKIEFLDRPISETIALIRSIPLREKITLLIDAVVTLFSISTGINLGEPISRNLSELLDAFKDRYPNLYRILVEDRDRLIAHRLKSILLCERGSIVAVVGIGHLRGLSRFLFKGSEAPQIPVVRLSLQWAIKTYGL
jgi:pheromone shutdown protein TraB